MRIVETLPARGAEADLHIVVDAAGTRRVAKIYRHGITPKEEVLKRIQETRPTHVVRLEEYGNDDGQWWELLEYIEHGNLRDRLAEAGRALPEADVRRVLAQLAGGLDGLHAIGLEHRDLKPENVLVRRREPIDVVIADWGIASVLEATVVFTTVARTIRYAPPEAVGGVVTDEQGASGTVSAIERTRWDAWSIGMMVVEMVTGEHPFAQVAEAGVIHRLATQDVDELSEHVTDPTWQRLCRGLLRRRPAHRWGTAEIRRWLADPYDPNLTVAEEQAVRTGIEFDRRRFTDHRDLGRALQQAGEAKAESFWRRRFADLRDWITDSLGKDEIGDALDKVDQDPELSLSEQVFLCIHHLWPEAPIIVDGVLLREDVLHEMARRAWGGDDEAAAQLVRLASDPRVELVAKVVHGAEAVQKVHDTWQRAAKDYAVWRERLAAKDLAIPEWRGTESGTPDEKIEVQTVAGVEIRVDTSTGAPRLPVQIQAAVLGAAIGETACTEGLRSMTEQATQQWRETKGWLAKALSADVEHAPALAAALYGALELQKRDDEKKARQRRRQRRRRQERAEAERVAQWRWVKRLVWIPYWTALGLVLGLVLGWALVSVPTLWIYIVLVVLLGGGIGGLVGGLVGESWTGALVGALVGIVVVGIAVFALDHFGFGQQIVWVVYWGPVVLCGFIGFAVGCDRGEESPLPAEKPAPPLHRCLHGVVTLLIVLCVVYGLRGMP